MTAVPIQLADLYAGFAAARGLLRDDGDHLMVEFEVIDKLLKTFKSGVKQVRVPVAAVVDVRFESGWFGGGKIVSNTTQRFSAARPCRRGGSRSRRCTQIGRASCRERV